MKNKRQEFIWIDLGACIYPTHGTDHSLQQQWQIGCRNIAPLVSSEGIECPLQTFRSRLPPLQHVSQWHIRIRLWIMRRELASSNSMRLLLHPCRKHIQRLHVDAPVSFHLHHCILQFQIDWFALRPPKRVFLLILISFVPLRYLITLFTDSQCMCPGFDMKWAR